MKKLFILYSVILSTSACVTHMDVAYNQKLNHCIYSEKLKGESVFGSDRVLEKTITYENTQCSEVISSDLKNAVNKHQAIITQTHIIDKPLIGATNTTPKENK